MDGMVLGGAPAGCFARANDTVTLAGTPHPVVFVHAMDGLQMGRALRGLCGARKRRERTGREPATR